MRIPNKEKLSYEELSDAARFREQYRFIFTGAIIATVFVAPSNNSPEVILKTVLVFSGSFAALYLVMSAATVKYKNNTSIYEVFRISERFRMRMYDFAVDVFGFALLLILGLLAVGAVQQLFSIKFEGVFSWIAVTVATSLIALPILLINTYFKNREDKIPKKDKPVI